MTVKKALNANLQAAKQRREDEFYTQLSDIENELKHYRPHFKGKVVYCNCDDPRASQFFHYFSYNFEKLGLKKLIATCYKNKDRDAFSTGASSSAIYLEYEGDKDGNFVPDPEEIGIELLEGDGDFRSSESIELLQQADIVVTNPPFSLFREFVAQMMEYDKQFLIVGRQDALTTREVGQLFQQGKIWLGANSGDMKFKVPDHYEARDTRYWVDKSGQKWRSMGNACWYTNLDYAKRHEDQILFKKYDPAEYPKYVNYDAIEVPNYKSIPMDYDGPMGLPVTFLTRHNPDQFEIIGFSGELARPMKEVVPNGKGSGRFYLDNGDGTYKRKFDRVVLRNKKP